MKTIRELKLHEHTGYLKTSLWVSSLIKISSEPSYTIQAELRSYLTTMSINTAGPISESVRVSLLGLNSNGTDRRMRIPDQGS